MVAWALPKEAGKSMFNVINIYTRASAMRGLPAESSFRLQRVGGGGDVAELKHYIWYDIDLRPEGI